MTKENQTGQEAQKDFDVKMALDKKGFAEFLVSYEGSENLEMTNAEEIKKKFETFERVETLSKKYIEIMSGKIQEEMGLKLSPEDFECVDSSFQEMAINNPDELLKIEETLKNYQELPLQIAALENDICKIGGSVEQLTDKRNTIASEKDLIEKALKTVGFGRIKRIFQKISGTGDARQLKEEWDARESIKEKYSDDFLNKETMNASIDGYTNSISKLEDKIKNISDLVKSREELVGKFNKKRTELFEEMKSFDGVIKIIKKKVGEQMNNLLLSGEDMKDFEKVHDRLAKLRQANEGTGLTGGILKEGGFDSDQAIIDEELGGFITEQIYNTIDNVKLGNGAFSNLEKGLNKIIKRETLGSKNKEETKMFMKEELYAVIQTLDMTKTEDKAKRLMILRIISTFE
jgi:hypothetical protein